MMISEDMVKRFIEANRMASGSAEFRVRTGLERALADHELPPFMLTENEEARVRAYEHESASVGQNELAAIVRRAQRTLAPKQAERPRVTMAEANAVYEAAARDHESLTAQNVNTRVALERFLAERAAPPQDVGLSGGVRVSEYSKLTRRIAELDTDRSAAYDRIAELEACLGKTAETFRQSTDESTALLATSRARIATLESANAQLAEPRNDFVGNLQMSTGCALHGEGEPNEEQPRGEWTEEDYERANDAFYDRRPSFAEREPFSRAQYPRIVAALDAVKHRLAAPAIEPPTELEQAAFDVLELGPHMAPSVARDCVAAWRKRFPKPGPKQKTPRELLAVIRNSVSDDYEDALDELVRLAEIGASK